MSLTPTYAAFNFAFMYIIDPDSVNGYHMVLGSSTLKG